MTATAKRPTPNAKDKATLAKYGVSVDAEGRINVIAPHGLGEVVVKTGVYTAFILPCIAEEVMLAVHSADRRRTRIVTGTSLHDHVALATVRME